ncbi:HalOD1 output domain-containing protein [Haladaptatus salinisoli]|uniref:HalOD1 output domain-containing protein n=1 Tax=Haladaptatus salinisoli TaxID=2884876 RepID=UPI001D0BC7E6|nr:HalOD1 output domain-containing protein [Haladaptatus salinisoli]
MNGESQTTKTTRWFGSTTEQSGSNSFHQYALIASETIDAESSSSELATDIINALIDVIEPATGQTTLTLYEYVNPDALEDIITASAEKKSDIEVRFTVEGYLVTVRSNNTILIYESLGAHPSTSEKPSLAS